MYQTVFFALLVEFSSHKKPSILIECCIIIKFMKCDFIDMNTTPLQLFVGEEDELLHSTKPLYQISTSAGILSKQTF